MFKLHTPPAGERFWEGCTVEAEQQKALPFFARVSAMPYNTVWPGCQRPVDQTEESGFILGETDAPVRMKVTFNRPISRVILRPRSKAVSVKVEGRNAFFTLPGPGQYTLEADGQHCPLHIFLDPPGNFGIDPTDPKVKYFGPGVHEIGDMILESGDTVYLEAGAVLYGSMTALHSEHITVAGHGVLDGSREVRTDDTGLIAWDMEKPIENNRPYLENLLREQKVLNGCLRFYACRDVKVLGVTLRDAASFALIPEDCVGVDIHWVKTIGMWRYNSDGIDFINSSDGLVEDCFLRDFDDCMVIKGHKGWDHRDLARITMRRLTVWCDWGRALEIGAETCADSYHDILFEDCDILHSAHIWMDIQNGDRARVHDVTFRDIRCELTDGDLPCVYQKDMGELYDPAHQECDVRTLIKAHSYDGIWSQDHILGRIDHILFEKITVTTENCALLPSVLEGADAEHLTEDILLRDVTVNGKKVSSLQALNMACNEFTRNIRVE